MKLRDRDHMLSVVARIGRNVALPKVPEPKAATAIDAVQRQIGDLSSVVGRIASHTFSGPLYARDSDQILIIDARPGSRGANVLTAAQAASEGLPAWTGLVSFKHGLRVVLDRWQVIDWSLNNPTVGATGQVISAGGIIRYSASSDRTVFQITEDAQAQQVLAVIALWSSTNPPVGAETAETLDQRVLQVRAQDVSTETLKP